MPDIIGKGEHVHLDGLFDDESKALDGFLIIANISEVGLGT